MVTIVLEEDGSRFTVQSALLCSASDYFVKALEGPFKEANERTLSLPGCDAKIFSIFLYWMCNRELPNLNGPSEKDDRFFDSMFRWQKLLIRLWVFGDAYLIPALCQDSIDYILRILHQDAGTTFDLVQFAYETTPEGSMIRKVFLI